MSRQTLINFILGQIVYHFDAPVSEEYNNDVVRECASCGIPKIENPSRLPTVRQFPVRQLSGKTVQLSSTNASQRV